MFARRYSPMVVLAFAFMLALCVASLALAQSADTLRASGQAGERYDGYMQARDPKVAGEVHKINDERHRVYSIRAEQEGVSIGEVGRVFAQQLIEQSPPGTWILTESGQWVQK